MSNTKKILYVGGIDEIIDQRLLTAAFIPFGDIVEVQIPLDPGTQKNKGFGFVEFELAEDATQALDNMNYSELNGKVIKVSYAKPHTIIKSRPIWENEDVWNKEEEKGEGEDEVVEILNVE